MDDLRMDAVQQRFEEVLEKHRPMLTRSGSACYCAAREAPSSAMLQLTPKKARIFRITHVENVPWALDHGLHSPASGVRDPHFRAIGNPEIIERRARRKVPIEPGGTLADYVAFYFTPYSPMLLNIKTGQGMPMVPMSKIAIIVTSLRRLAAERVRFVYTDRHASLAAALFFGSLDDLGSLDWRILQARDFRRSTEDPGKLERYQAEARVYRHLPVRCLEGIACYDAEHE